MSAYAEYETEFKDPDILKQALCEVQMRTGRKLTEHDIEFHEKAVPLVGYQGDQRKDTAEIIIRRSNVGGASNDIGFKKTESGGYKAIVSEYDRGFYNDSWMNKLTVTYSEMYVQAKAKKLGYRVEKQNVDGKIRMTLSRWR